MIRPDLQAIVLACTQSQQSYAYEKICGRELMLYPLAMLEKLAIPVHVIINEPQQKFNTIMSDYAQHHAVTVLEQSELFNNLTVWHKKDIVILQSTMPFISANLLEQLYNKHVSNGAAITMAIAHAYDAHEQYERVIKKDKKIRIVDAHSNSSWIDGGVYIISKEFFNEINSFDLQHLLEHAYERNLKVATLKVPFDGVRSVNSHQELWAAEQIERSRLIKQWMNNGVYFSAPQTVQLDHDVTIGQGTTIANGVHLLRGSVIGAHCIISINTILEHATIADHTVIDAHSVIRNASIGAHSRIGPFAHVHTNSVIGSHTIIGNFVEVKESVIGNNTKAKHLNYLGNAQIGNEVNIGAGTITCNHNGVNREQTTIHDRAYVGSNNSLVAPVTIESNAFTAAGSVITKNVPENALAIARAHQINKEGYAVKLRSKFSKAIFKGAQKVNNPDSTC